MNLYELIQHIPEFINQVLVKQNSSKGVARQMLGKFYLGLNYDY